MTIACSRYFALLARVNCGLLPEFFFFFQFFPLADSLFSFPLTFNSFYQIFWMFCLTFIYQWNVAVIFIC